MLSCYRLGDLTHLGVHENIENKILKEHPY